MIREIKHIAPLIQATLHHNMFDAEAASINEKLGAQIDDMFWFAIVPTTESIKVMITAELMVRVFPND
jgi:hypothetical protein